MRDNWQPYNNSVSDEAGLGGEDHNKPMPRSYNVYCTARFARRHDLRCSFCHQTSQESKNFLHLPATDKYGWASINICFRQDRNSNGRRALSSGLQSHNFN